MATVTDKEKFDAKIIDESRYEELSDRNKKLFIIARNSMLEIFPTVESKGESFDDIALEYAENFAFIQIGIFQDIIDSVDTLKLDLEKKIKDVETLIQQAATTSVSTATGV